MEAKELLNKGIRLQLVLSDICNNSCGFCEFHSGAMGYMSDEVLENVYRLIETQKDKENVWITLTGGESLMHPNFKDICYSLIDILGDRLDLQVNTNFQHNLYEKLPNDIKENINFLSITLHEQFVKDVDDWFNKVSKLQKIDTQEVQITLMLRRETYNEVLDIYYKYKQEHNLLLKYVYEDYDFLKNLDIPEIKEALHDSI